MKNGQKLLTHAPAFIFFIVLIFETLNMPCAFAYYYDTLPKGIRTVVLRQVLTGKIEGTFDTGSEYSPYNVHLNLDPETVSGNAFSDWYISQLKDVSPEAYARFSLGEYKGSATAKANVKVIGAGYGLTDRLTPYFVLPFYKVNVDLDFKRTGGSNMSEVAALIRQSTSTNPYRDLLASMTEAAPDATPGLLQSVVTNYYGYKPLGNWEGEGLGDLEFGAMYKLTDYQDKGAQITLGAVAPTGKEDDIDALQSISFGDGQWDAFFEGGGSYRFNPLFSLESWARYTYQFPYDREIRLPTSSEYPLTKEKGPAHIKLGNKILYAIQSNFYPNDWLTLSPIYTYEFTGKAQYKTSNHASDPILEEKSQKTSHVFRFNIGISTFPLYYQKKFVAPLLLNLAAQTIYAGHSTPKYNRYDLELRLFF